MNLIFATTPFLLAAVQLYERHGFRYTGEQPDLFGTKLLTMAKDVRDDGPQQSVKRSSALHVTAFDPSR